MSKISYTYLICDIFVIIFSFIKGGNWLLNTQIAFISSMLITFASFYAYKKSIKKRVESYGGEEFRDVSDELEDPYNLFEDEDDEKTNNRSRNSGVFKYTIKGFASGIGGAINPLRLLSYGFLIVSFLILTRSGLFNAFAFFAGLSVVPITSIFSLILKQNK
ncbi:MAG: hypothetical protein GXP61_00255 [Epsilonproteobacteria bacterium]|nr:hypothetical protein [Campylobacterota bacterium]